ncbi:MAG: DUF885 domain-containing protein [Candidatus Eremiobacteraeota bacterium]|nr:DUF885 domain-containing protein [Candidatus Eremiobacteraeota bacterium]
MNDRLRATSRVLALTAALACALPAAAADRPLGDQRLEALATRYFDAVWKMDPNRATRTGVHAYDDKLTDLSAAGFNERIAFARKTLADVRAIDANTYGADASYDARMLEASLESILLQLQTRQTWRHDPSFYTGQASSAVYGLLTRDFAPLKDRVHSTIARERQIPAMLEHARENVTAVDATTGEIARGNMRGTLTFFQSVVPAAVAKVNDKALAAQFKTANDAAVAAIGAYVAAMEAGPLAHPSGTYAIGPQTFERMLELQELSPITLAQYERVGSAALAKTKADFVETAKKIDPSKPAEAVAAALGVQHPAGDMLLKAAGDDLVALRKFVIAHKIVTLPPDNDVKVVATPEFARATTFASMNSPGALEKVATEAYYNVTPVETDWTPERKEQHLAFFNNYAFPIVSLHEVMPGHYVNFALDKHERLSLIRRLLASSSFAEGWAHYDEQMMVDEGWGNGDPRVRLAQLRLALQRECRYLVGLREHTQGMSVADGTKFFRENAFLAEEPAHREALRGTQDPLYGYYTLGKLELLKLRDDYKTKMGSKYSLLLFHDEFLAHGDPPISIVRKIMLGADDDGKLL